MCAGSLGRKLIPFPNVIAGCLIGFTVSGWGELLVACVGWAFVFCLYVWIAESNRVALTICAFKERGQRLLFGSPALTFFAIEWVTALATSLPFAAIVAAVRFAL